MTAGARRVRTVRLQAASDALVRRGALLLEDALRTASLPPVSGGRVLLVRSLPVGVIRADRSPATLSLAIEDQVRRLARWAVDAGSPSAESAPAVLFPDDAAPPRALALRLARGQPAAAWFWPLAVPGYRRDLPRDEALRLTLERALSTEAGPVAAAALVGALVEAGVIDALLGALRGQDGPALLRACGWPAATAAGAVAAPDDLSLETKGGPAEVAATDLSPRWAAPARRWIDSWGAGDARSMWLAAIALVAKVPTRLASPALPARAARLARRIAAAPEPRANRGPEPRTVTPSPPRAGAPLLDDDAPRLGRPPATPESPSNERPMKGLPQETPHRGDGPAPRSEGALTASAPKATPPAQQEAPAAIPGEHPPETPEQGSPQGEPPRPRNAQPAAWPDHPLPTALGGLLFLLPVLSRIGIAERLDRTPELHDLALAARFLVHVGERLGEAPDDPMLTALRPAGDLGGDDLGPVLHELLVSARRWCRRRARLGLRTLVCRPGHVVATATHVDVIFDLAGADIRVRRAALDVDPGWVPWLGRVVSFHYQRGWRDG